MGYTHGIKVNEEFLKAHPEFKCEVPNMEIKVGDWFVEKTTNWDFTNENCLKKLDIDLIVTKDVAGIYE